MLQNHIWHSTQRQYTKRTQLKVQFLNVNVHVKYPIFLKFNVEYFQELSNHPKRKSNFFLFHKTTKILHVYSILFLSATMSVTLSATLFTSMSATMCTSMSAAMSLCQPSCRPPQCNVVSTLCAGSETLAEWKSESMTYQYLPTGVGARDTCVSKTE